MSPPQVFPLINRIFIAVQTTQEPPRADAGFISPQDYWKRHGAVVSGLEVCFDDDPTVIVIQPSDYLTLGQWIQAHHPQVMLADAAFFLPLLEQCR